MSELALTPYDLLGLLGTLVYLASYTALQLGWMSGHGYGYTVANTVAATLVLISLSAAFNLSSTLVQVFWIVIGVGGLGRKYLLNRRIRFTP